ncbi:uncharacterized protein LOC118647644 isoform X2 [Monomorium pharaonis]|uniref:uncharacterized protein LOC118647643 isoform X2 n=1 Tax=Monomorium pharaonis TaxID=307658 RepID=UPI0017462C1F|nr:uncharacterized protein LOC118647643 isoform X2 [Monomorium pharaonis]XP_036148809.1 uncharacterized protein LOC118647644 isoform X2 [Monomorium pharaonis]
MPLMFTQKAVCPGENRVIGFLVVSALASRIGLTSSRKHVIVSCLTDKAVLSSVPAVKRPSSEVDADWPFFRSVVSFAVPCAFIGKSTQVLDDGLHERYLLRDRLNTITQPLAGAAPPS